MLGKRIRVIRKEQRRTQEEIAKVCGFTKSLLSKIESGQTMPAVATLMKIANALGVKVSDLLDEEAPNETVWTCANQYQDETKWIQTDKGYSFFAFAIGRRNKIMQPYLFIAKQGEVKKHLFSHEGEEFIYVLSGSMRYKVGNTDYVMNEGDGIYFNSMEEHTVTPISEQVKYLAVFTEMNANEKA
ncbi:helix-turn-helix domain-containing protein [Paenibacillus sp. LMG 31461]|uniref:Helix-turn-helix domain-containing protein n=1 Tax=Paenibacillus plantarum TaxID=2654975 RepID=A0ABX1XK03_9BACL|nr:XRE family transcriptional regulator [Paenibacillus plantarum]NOU68878.1 helix-turn-helix domain-containing protein [Paenibacillus plantarum]